MPAMGQDQEPGVASDEAGGRGGLVVAMTERPEKITVLGGLLIATLTIQTATAAARNARKSARALVQVTQQLRERDGFSASTASRSCDRFWCYEDGVPVSAPRK
jgi:hypothetical protein